MKKNGFTLIELLVVITIIGILAAVGLASYRVANQKARDSRRQSDVLAIQSGLETYRTRNGYYPTSGQYTATSLSPITNFNNRNYFSAGALPVAPSPGTYAYSPTNSGGTGCTNSLGNNCYLYQLTYTLEIGGAKTVYNP